VVAVAGSADMLAAARQRLDGAATVVLRQGELEHVPVATGELDAAMLSLVLHYSPVPAAALSEVARSVRGGGRVVVVDMLPHDREDYQRQMGHVWLGFSEEKMTRLLAGAGFADVRLRALPSRREARGPGLFAASAVRT
jgi:ArsR family transcriptional regulator